MLRFSDGMSFNLEGKLHKEHRSDGWYIVGGGMLIPVNDDEVDKVLAEMRREGRDDASEKMEQRFDE